MARLRSLAAAIALGLAFALPAAAATDGPAVARARAAYEAARAQAGDAGAVNDEIALATALAAENRIDEAVPHFDHVRTVIVAASGPDAPEAILVTAIISIAMVNAGKPAEGEALAADAVERAVRTRGDADVVTAMAKAGLGSAKAMRGRYADAYPLLQAGYAGMAAAYGEGALETRQIGAVLLNTTQGLGFDAEALALRRKLAEPPRTAGVPPANDPVVLFADGQRVALLNSEGRYADARDLAEPLMPRIVATLGPGHPSTLEARASLAAAYSGLGDWRRAVAAMREVYARQLAARGADDLMTLAYQERLANMLLAASDIEARKDGRALMLVAVEHRRKVQGATSAQAVLAEVRLAMSYMDDVDEGDGAAVRASLDRAFNWLVEADRAVVADPAQADSLSASAVNVLIGVQLINQRDYANAYARLSRSAARAQARSRDRRVATSSDQALAVLTSNTFLFTNQIRAGWLWAHQK